MNFLRILVILILTGLFITPTIALTTDVNSTGNNTQINTNAVWTTLLGSPHTNLTINSLGRGTNNQTIITVSFESMVNYTTSAFQARLIRDGVVLNTFNITQLANIRQSNAFTTGISETTTGSHTYALQAWSTAGRQATIYKWNMTTVYNEAGTYLSNTSILNTSSVTVTNNNNGTIQLNNLATGFTSVNTTQGGRAEDVVYQNTGTSARFISISYTSGVNGNCRILTDANNPPTTWVSGQNTAASLNVNLYAIVLPNHYYMLKTIQATCAANGAWIEWN